MIRRLARVRRMTGLVAAALAALSAVGTAVALSATADGPPRPDFRTGPGAAAPASARLSTPGTVSSSAPDRPTTSTSGVADPAAGALASALAAALGGHTGCAAAMAGGRQVAVVGPGVAVAPASTQKLLVAAAALSVLGPQHRFLTRVVSSGPVVAGVAPRLWLVGSGDPMLVTAGYQGLVMTHSHEPGPPVTPFGWLVNALRAAGVTSVPGGVSGDDTLLSPQRFLPTWKPVYVSEGDVGALSALSLDEGWDAWLPRWVPTADPPTHAAAALSWQLALAGVRVGPVGPDGPPPPGAVTVASVSSAPLSSVVAYMLATSDNHVAELLTRAVGLAVAGQGTTAAGTQAVLDVVSGLGVDTSGAVMVDGSGLSTQNRATCAELLGVYEAGGRPDLAALRTGLPVAGRDGTLYQLWRHTPLAGRVVAKTGWINGAAAVVGTVRGHRPVDFAFAVNGQFGFGPAYDMETAALDALAAYAG
ncbi:MAG TPA: D-alanyl-D-alanine carboxypeptidase [Acidimicrobiales bacterium]|nr:D-alanyl-D-alanine carboxypeptidase [Acidimicrobiales bacterium]